MKNFVETAYIPDVLLAAAYYKDEGLAGIGGGVKNYLCYGGFPLDDDWTRLLFPRGVVKNRDLAKPLTLDETKITEDVTHSWYQGRQAPAPLRGDDRYPNTPTTTRTDTSRATRSTPGARRPATTASPMRWGRWPASSSGYAQGDQKIKDLVDSTLKATGLPATVLFSTLGRTAARALETKLVADHTRGLGQRAGGQHQGRRHPDLDPLRRSQGRPGARHDGGAARVALGHWIRIEEQGHRQLPGRRSLDLELLAEGQGRTSAAPTRNR